MRIFQAAVARLPYFCGRLVCAWRRMPLRGSPIFFVRSPHHDLQRIIQQWPLQSLGLIRRRAHPDITFFIGRQDHRHRLWMGPDDRVPRTRITFLTVVGEHEQKSRALRCLRPRRFVRLSPGLLRVVRPRECSLKTIRASAGLRCHPAMERFEPAGVLLAHARVRFWSHP